MGRKFGIRFDHDEACRRAVQQAARRLSSAGANFEKMTAGRENAFGLQPGIDAFGIIGPRAVIAIGVSAKDGAAHIIVHTAVRGLSLHAVPHFYPAIRQAS